MEQVFALEAPEGLCHLPAVGVLRRVWVQNYLWTPDGPLFRDTDNIPPASLFINSLYDEQAHLSTQAQHLLGRVQGTSAGTRYI